MLRGDDIAYFKLSIIYLKLVQQCRKNSKEFFRLVGILTEILDKEIELPFCILPQRQYVFKLFLCGDSKQLKNLLRISL